MKTRPVKMRTTIEYIEDVPIDWTEEDINFFYNHSRWCATNVVPILDEMSCLCDFSTFEYMREATDIDIINREEFKTKK